MTNHYQVLGLATGASTENICRAYRILALQNHPDRTILLGANERSAREENFKRISGAYEVLSDTESRTAYDAKTFGLHRCPAPASYDHRDSNRAHGSKSTRRTAERKRQKREHRRERERQAEWERREQSRKAREDFISPEDTRYVSKLSLMGETMERKFGPWEYQICLSKCFQRRVTTEPAESSADLATELIITVKLDAIPPTRPVQSIASRPTSKNAAIQAACSTLCCALHLAPTTRAHCRSSSRWIYDSI